jgi:hypothetical protein
MTVGPCIPCKHTETPKLVRALSYILRMRHNISRRRLVAGCIAIAGAFYMVWASTNAFHEAGHYFARATYVAACIDTPRTGTPEQCDQLATIRPRLPEGVETTDRSVLLAEGSAMHSTGTGVLTLTGIWLAAWSLALAATSGSARRETSRKRRGTNG